MDPIRTVTVIADKIDVTEIRRKFFFGVSSKKSIKKLIPTIRSIDGKIIARSLINSKLFVMKRRSPVKNRAVPVNKIPCRCFPKKV